MYIFLPFSDQSLFNRSHTTLAHGATRTPPLRTITPVTPTTSISHAIFYTPYCSAVQHLSACLKGS